MLNRWPIPFFIILSIAAFERGSNLSAALAFVSAVLSVSGPISIRERGRGRIVFLLMAFLLYLSLRFFRL